MKKAVVAMSGGVDSSAACAVLLDKGFEVIGVTLRFFSPLGRISCCGADESINKAKQVCHKLGIRHYVKDARAFFKKYVMDDFANGYLSGRTPNPCVECNRKLKFDYLFSIAETLGADFLATGHYALLKQVKGETALFRGKDPLKDQSYFLYCLPAKKLNKILFPLGEIEKTETRKIADKLGLPNAKSAESKDICFIPNGDYKSWLKENGKAENVPGYVKDESGKILGRHKGFFYFTVGQRRNLGISSSQRLYVSALNPKENEVIVSPLEGAMFSGFLMSQANWLKENIDFEKKHYVQIRYRHKPCKASVKKEKDGLYSVKFEEKQFAAAKGQSAVFYEKDRVLGGGIIEEAFK